MMKSYQEWTSEPVFNEIVKEMLTESWVGGSSRNWQRIAMLFGFSREPMGLNPFSKNSWQSMGQFLSRGSAGASRKGDEILSTLEKAVSGEIPLNDLIKMAGNNSPFRLCFNEAQSVKQKLTGRSLDAEDTKMLLNVLENFHSNGHIDPGQLKMLWHSLTGNAPDDTNPKGNPKAIDLDVHTPSHLLNRFKGYGGHGIFSFPSNYQQDIQQLSKRIIKTYYPEFSNKLLGKKPRQSSGGNPNPQPNNTGSNSNNNSGNTGVSSTNTGGNPIINNPSELVNVLGKGDYSSFDQNAQKMIFNLLNYLGGKKGT